MKYNYYKRVVIDKFDAENIDTMYNNGYVFGRIEKGQMDQIQGLKIDLNENFSFNSENRRVLRKVEWMSINVTNLPIPHDQYDFNIHKLGKEFFTKKNPTNVFTAAKIKQLVTDSQNSNFNTLFSFKDSSDSVVGYVICYIDKKILHYAYPFYNTEHENKNIGMGMILKSIEFAVSNKIETFYLGSVYTQKSLYKLQFNNQSWWDGNKWNQEIDILKEKVRSEVD